MFKRNKKSCIQEYDIKKEFLRFQNFYFSLQEDYNDTKSLLINIQDIEHPQFDIILPESEIEDIENQLNLIRELLDNKLYKTLSYGNPFERLKNLSDNNEELKLVNTSWYLENKLIKDNDKLLVEIRVDYLGKPAHFDYPRHNNIDKKMFEVITEDGEPRTRKLPNNKARGTVDTVYYLKNYEEDIDIEELEKKLKVVSVIFENEDAKINLDDMFKKINYYKLILEEIKKQLLTAKNLLEEEDKERELDNFEDEKINYESLI